MRASVRIKVDMAVRVRDFLRANPFESANGIAVTAQFEARVARALDLIAQVDHGETLRRTAVRRKHGLRRQLRTVTLRHLERIGTAAAKEKPELAGQLRMPLRPTEQEFRAAAGNIVMLTAANRELLDRYGLVDAIPEELDRGLVEFDRAVSEINAGRISHTGARMELGTLTSELIAMGKQLDGMMLYRFREAPGLEGGWNSARNVAWPLNRPKPESPAA
ncbi:MAG: hypothetical protein ACYC2K_10140 [Gemmatimonadales bacterium]